MDSVTTFKDPETAKKAFFALIMMFSMNIDGCFPVGEISSIFTFLLCFEKLNNKDKREKMDGTICPLSLFDSPHSDDSILPPEILQLIIFNHFKSAGYLVLLSKYVKMIQRDSGEIIKYSLVSLNKYGYCPELNTALRQFYRPEDDDTEVLIPYNKEWSHFLGDDESSKDQVVQCLKDFGLDDKVFLGFKAKVMINCSKECGVRDTGYYFDLPCEYCSSLCKTPICNFYDKPCEDCEECRKAEEVRMHCGNDDD